MIRLKNEVQTLSGELVRVQQPHLISDLKILPNFNLYIHSTCRVIASSPAGPVLAGPVLRYVWAADAQYACAYA